MGVSRGVVTILTHYRMSEVRLKDFKAVFDRHGLYRFYFKTQDPDCGVVREEVSHTHSLTIFNTCYYR